MGSLTLYRQLIYDNVFSGFLIPAPDGSLMSRKNRSGSTAPNLPPVGHGIAGILAGWTVSFVAAPVEHIKARLQIQYAADKSLRLYSGPVDCIQKIVGAVCAVVLIVSTNNMELMGSSTA